ncbi:MAG: peptidoglycan-binding protein [Treponema sp.]|jgi:hypothetical protein|nr:peptidoglycan-binding protein [Treponema sp.]
MICDEVRNKVYETFGEQNVPFLLRIRIMTHLCCCGRCAKEYRKLRTLTQTLTQDDFFPAVPLSNIDNIMGEIERLEEAEINKEHNVVPVSLRGWVIIGFIMLISLSSLVFGMGFMKVVSTQGRSFLLPVSLTIGCVVTGYGAMFIGSHLKELSDRFLR